MKRTRSVGKANEPPKGMQGLVVSDEDTTQLPVESNLSPGRVADGASTTTILLSQILAQQDQLHEIRDWGINE